MLRRLKIYANMTFDLMLDIIMMPVFSYRLRVIKQSFSESPYGFSQKRNVCWKLTKLNNVVHKYEKLRYRAYHKYYDKIAEDEESY